MKLFTSVFLLTAILFTGCINKSGNKAHKYAKIIFDTDLGPDYDDVGALAFLHAMADSGKQRFLQHSPRTSMNW